MMSSFDTILWTVLILLFLGLFIFKIPLLKPLLDAIGDWINFDLYTTLVFTVLGLIALSFGLLIIF